MSISSMTAVVAPRELIQSRSFMERPPYETHWTRTCEHDLVARLKKYESGTKAKMQCRKCGCGVGQWVPARGVFEVWDEELEARAAESYGKAVEAWHQGNREAHERFAAEKSEAWWSAYNKYLKSAVWQRKRQLVMERNRRLHGGLCEACGENRPSDVHHTEYPQTFGHEPLWTLKAICRRCHEIFHPHMRES